MPSNLLQADVGFPQFKEDQKPDEKITQVVNYLYMLLEQLRYSFGNLDADNFSESGITELEHLIAEPVYAYITNVEEGLSTALNVTAQGLSTRITNEIAGVNQTITATAEALTAQIGTVDGKYTALSASVDGLNVQINDPTDGAFAKITANANAIATKVSAGDVSSAITQFANGLALSVTNGASSSTIKLMSGSTQLSSKTIQITGMVTFSDLSTAGNTTINGANITTGTIAAANVGVTGAFSVSSGQTNGGYMGYITTPSGNYGVGVKHKTNSGGALYVTNNGAKITSGSSEQGQVYVYNTAIYMKAYDTSNAASKEIYFDGPSASFYPGATSQYINLGKSGAYWNNAYIRNIYITGNIYQNGVVVI